MSIFTILFFIVVFACSWGITHFIRIAQDKYNENVSLLVLIVGLITTLYILGLLMLSTNALHFLYK